MPSRWTHRRVRVQTAAADRATGRRARIARKPPRRAHKVRKPPRRQAQKVRKPPRRQAPKPPRRQAPKPPRRQAPKPPHPQAQKPPHPQAQKPAHPQAQKPAHREAPKPAHREAPKPPRRHARQVPGRAPRRAPNLLIRHTLRAETSFGLMRKWAVPRMCLLASALWVAARHLRRRREGTAGTTARLLATRHPTGKAHHLRAVGTVCHLPAAGTAPGTGRRAMSSSRRPISAHSPLTPSRSFRPSIGCTEVGVTGTSVPGSPSSDAPTLSGVADSRSFGGADAPGWCDAADRTRRHLALRRPRHNAPWLSENIPATRHASSRRAELPTRPRGAASGTKSRRIASDYAASKDCLISATVSFGFSSGKK
jgi:hypothetical protein